MTNHFAPATEEIELVENAGGIVAGAAFLLELTYLKGRDLLTPYTVVSILAYDQ